MSVTFHRLRCRKSLRQRTRFWSQARPRRWQPGDTFRVVFPTPPGVAALSIGASIGRVTRKYRRANLEDFWNLDLAIVETEFTLVGVTPALDKFKDVAATMRAEAEELARKHGASLAS
jgi:hypothetical protein